MDDPTLFQQSSTSVVFFFILGGGGSKLSVGLVGIWASEQERDCVWCKIITVEDTHDNHVILLVL